MIYNYYCVWLAGLAHRLRKQVMSITTSLWNCSQYSMATLVARCTSYREREREREREGETRHTDDLALVIHTSLSTSPPLPSPHLTSPHLTSPHLTSPHLTSPHLTSPHLTSPHLTSPHLTSPHLTSPHLTSPHLTSPHLTSPHLSPTCLWVVPVDMEYRCTDHLGYVSAVMSRPVQHS